MVTTRKEEIGFEHKGIGAILSQNRLAVPLNQREYSWEEEHVTDLFEDFARAIDKNKATYFVGTIVLTRGEGELPEVSDGQQRLATTTILLSAIRDYFFRQNELKRASSIESDFLQKTDRKTTNIVPQLQLNVDDNEFFVKFILSSPDSPDRKILPSKESHKRITKAAEIASRHIQNIVSTYTRDESKYDRLLDWVDFVQDGAQVILLKVPDHINAFLMFETLNDRGLKASQADLLKNHLLSLAGNNRIKEGQSRWAEMLGALETIGEDDITVTFLHHLLITKHGPITGREVFDKVKTTIDNQSRAFEFLHELPESANQYSALFNPQHKKWNDYATATRKHLAIMKDDLRVLQIRPLMFAVTRHFSVKEAELAFKLFVSWSVRFLIVGGRGGLLDRNYAVAAQQIALKKIKTAKELAVSLTEVIPSDALFQAAFSEARVSKAYLARYYLRALELKRKGDSEPELVPNDDEQTINLEHILPENPDSKEWPNVDVETASANHSRIGNLVILQAKKNSMIGNSSFEKKKEVLKDSAFLLTKDASNYSEWSIKQINERQKQLAELATKTWPISV